MRQATLRAGLTYNGSFGPWRSLASALAWGARGPEFKSRRPDQIPQRLTDTNPQWTLGLESNRSPNVDAGRTPSAHTKNTVPISWHVSHPRKTCHARHFRPKPLILFLKPMSGCFKKPDIHPTFPTKNPTFGRRLGAKRITLLTILKILRMPSR